MSDEESPTLDELRRGFAEGAAEPAGPCPPPSTIWEAAAGELAADRLREVVEHTASCPACALDWRLARELGARRQEPRASAPPPGAAAGRRHRSWAAAAVVAAGLVLALSLPLLRRVEERPAMRGGDAPAAAFAPVSAELPRADPELRWARPLPAGASYDLTVTVEGTTALVVHDEGLTERSYRFPEEKTAALPAGTRLSCQVRVSLPEGRSEIHRFTLTLR